MLQIVYSCQIVYLVFDNINVFYKLIAIYCTREALNLDINDTIVLDLS